MPMAPCSFTITAMSPRATSPSQRFTSVVLPAPRKPVTTVTGTGARAGTGTDGQ